MLLGHGLQRTNTTSSALSVKENAEKKKSRHPLILAALVPTVNESKHTFFIIVLIKLFLFCVMLLGYGLQRTNTTSSAPSVKETGPPLDSSYSFGNSSI